eukprot:s2019_g9.t3
MAVALLTQALAELEPSEKLYYFGPSAYRACWDFLLGHFGLQNYKDRGGGAVWVYHRGCTIGGIRWRMRMKHQHTLSKKSRPSARSWRPGLMIDWFSFDFPNTPAKLYVADLTCDWSAAVYDQMRLVESGGINYWEGGVHYWHSKVLFLPSSSHVAALEVNFASLGRGSRGPDELFDYSQVEVKRAWRLHEEDNGGDEHWYSFSHTFPTARALSYEEIVKFVATAALDYPYFTWDEAGLYQRCSYRININECHCRIFADRLLAQFMQAICFDANARSARTPVSSEHDCSLHHCQPPIARIHGMLSCVAGVDRATTRARPQDMDSAHRLPRATTPNHADSEKGRSCFGWFSNLLSGCGRGLWGATLTTLVQGLYAKCCHAG